jgi:hypothetical protein
MRKKEEVFRGLESKENARNGITRKDYIERS